MICGDRGRNRAVRGDSQIHRKLTQSNFDNQLKVKKIAAHCLFNHIVGSFF